MFSFLSIALLFTFWALNKLAEAERDERERRERERLAWMFDDERDE